MFSDAGIKETSTLKVSPKGDKPFPRIVHREGERDGHIRKFLLTRRFIKGTMRELEL